MNMNSLSPKTTSRVLRRMDTNPTLKTNEDISIGFITNGTINNIITITLKCRKLISKHVNIKIVFIITDVYRYLKVASMLYLIVTDILKNIRHSILFYYSNTRDSPVEHERIYEGWIDIGRVYRLTKHIECDELYCLSNILHIVTSTKLKDIFTSCSKVFINLTLSFDYSCMGTTDKYKCRILTNNIISKLIEDSVHLYILDTNYSKHLLTYDNRLTLSHEYLKKMPATFLKYISPNIYDYLKSSASRKLHKLNIVDDSFIYSLFYDEKCDRKEASNIILKALKAKGLEITNGIAYLLENIEHGLCLDVEDYFIVEPTYIPINFHGNNYKFSKPYNSMFIAI